MISFKNIKGFTLLIWYITLLVFIITRLFNLPIIGYAPSAAYSLFALSACQIFCRFNKHENLTTYEYSLAFCAISLIAITM